MYFVLQTPSLQHLAGGKVVAELWTRGDHFSQIESQSLNCLPEDDPERESKEWKAIEEKVRNKISTLPLPETCEKQLFNFVKPLGMEIFDWCQYHSGGKNQFLNILLGNHFRWTMHGTVDYARTAELMVKDERLGMERRYEIACVNCLEDETRELFERMDEERRQEYIHASNSTRLTDHYSSLIDLFTRTFSGNRFPSGHCMGELFIKKLQFATSLCKSNRATCEYLFNKLNQGEKEQVLKEWMKIIDRCSRSPTCNVLYYLSLMDGGQQRSVFLESLLKKFMPKVIILFLRWPMHSLFMKTVKYGWGNMDKDKCVVVLLATDYQDYLVI